MMQDAKIFQSVISPKRGQEPIHPHGIVVVIKNATILDGMPQVSAVPYIISGCV